MEPDFLLDFVVSNILPFAAFFIGVFIADYTGLYRDLKRGNIWLISVPTGLLTTGILILSATVKVDETTILYGYNDSFHEYVIFFAVVMFYGTAAPELFASYRARIVRRNGPKD